MKPINPRTEDKLRKLAPLGKQATDLAWLYYLSSEGRDRGEADDLFDILLHQQAGKTYQKNIFLPPPHPVLCHGDYQLGLVHYPPGQPYCSFGLREPEWIQHVLITGMTGAGKTTLALHILSELARHQKPFLVFDWKRNYRDLLQLPQFSATRVFTVGSSISPFRFNPLLPPPGMEPGQWLMKLVDVIKHAYFVGEGVEYILSLDDYNIVCVKQVELANISSSTAQTIEIDEAKAVLIHDLNTLFESVKGFVYPPAEDNKETVCQRFFADVDALGFNATQDIDYEQVHLALQSS